MVPLNLAEVVEYIQLNIGPEYHAKKLAKLAAVSLDDIIKRKNPYLFKAKHTNSASEFITAVLDATISSGEETIFGNFLENLARFICGKVYGGRKSGTLGMDLEFEIANDKYLVSIKSGPNWGNSAQITNLVQKFQAARRTLATSGGAKGMRIICVEACCYGYDNFPERGTHSKLCGQRFWELISGGSESLYRDIIEPLGHQAREKREELELLKTTRLNVFTSEFVTRFCNDGVIDWDRLIRFNSGKDRGIEAQIDYDPNRRTKTGRKSRLERPEKI